MKCYRKIRRAKDKNDYETWGECDIANTINLFDLGDVRSTNLVVEDAKDSRCVMRRRLQGGRQSVCARRKTCALRCRASRNGNKPMRQRVSEHQAECMGGGSETMALTDKKIRRLTPLECERLQGFQDGWTDIGEWTDSKGKKHESSDAARYKALGNSIALPFWRYLLKRISAQYERTPTMASLFDGIGGFPLIWEGINGKGTAVWASEIEEFPIAVTKYHFPEDENDKR